METYPSFSTILPLFAQICQRYRDELKHAWARVSTSAWWQQVWKTFLEDQVDMAPWCEGYLKAQSSLPDTPPHNKRKPNSDLGVESPRDGGKTIYFVRVAKEKPGSY